MVVLVERNKQNTVFLMWILSISGLHMGYFISIFNPLGIPLLGGYYHLSESEIQSTNGNLAFLYCIGATIGTAFLGKLADTIGRIRLLFFVESGCLLACFMYLVGNLYFLQFSRFISGISAGLNNPISGIILVELLPKTIGEKGNMIIYISGAGGMLLSYLMPVFISKQAMIDHWRIILFWPAIIHLARVVLIFTRLVGHETPKYTCITHCHEPDLRDRIRDTLCFIYEDSNLDDEINELLHNNSEPTDPEKNFNTIRGLLSKDMIHKFISAIMVNVGQQITGIGFLIYYSTQLFDAISGNGVTMTIIVGISNIVGGLLGAVVVARFSEILIMKYGCYVQGAAMLMMVFCVIAEIYWILPLFLILYMVVYALSMGATMNLYVNQIVTPMGVSLAVAVSWVASGLVGKISPYAISYFGPNKMIIFYGACCLFDGGIIGSFAYDNTDDRKREAAKELGTPLVNNPHH